MVQEVKDTGVYRWSVGLTDTGVYPSGKASYRGVPMVRGVDDGYRGVPQRDRLSDEGT